jgi:hypothetical protein
MRSAIIPAAVAAVLMSAAANAAPIAPLHAAAITPAATMQFRVSNWGDHPLMYPGNWERHQRQWDAIEGRNGNAQWTSCARLRSYDRASQTYVNRNGRRVPCP